MKKSLLIIALLLSSTCWSQLSVSYSMGGISLDSPAGSSFGGPLVFSSEKSCLQINNGVIVFSSTSRGSAFFDPSCGGAVNTIAPLFRLAPNPSLGVTRLYSISNSPESRDNITVLILDATGRPVMQHICKRAQLNSGYPIQTNHLASGMYFVKVVVEPSNSSMAPLVVALKLVNTH